ncbi:mannose-6-phosphate isomerase, class I [Desulfosoma caldarium]|uniref:mannose-6-phosphate isomerase n=1 Tax=Desulfosoma caldarium TaxID=610254 RepID=A0A3N1UQZ4_9BACT|nr:mannose-6-phosphate isomerase, class I [Desulfosoma caldarium]ROQ92168.1 mannose-6-phosphate isomerase type 1 [Desulfosoma caldarium]
MTALEHLPGARPYRLHNLVQHYEWGERGPSAFIATLLGVTDSNPRPYAELWVGAHPSAPSLMEFPDGSKRPLPEAVKQWPQEILGSSVMQSFGSSWPFLFKILSAAEPLSIQAHPDADQARRLHQQDPRHYPDPNPKPEIAVALTPFRALVGFKPVAAWREIFHSFPEIASLMDAEVLCAASQADFIKNAFRRLLTKAQQSPELLAQTVEAVANRIHEAPSPLASMAHVFHQLKAKYGPTDMGLLVLFFLNPVELSPGQAVFLAPGLPHAYLQGNIVECMTNSDNVIRLGLTAKHKDLEAMAMVLDFEPRKVSVMTPTQGMHTVYSVPCDAFEVHRWVLASRTEVSVERPGGPEILFILQGGGRLAWREEHGWAFVSYTAGQSFLFPAHLPAYRLVAETETLAFTARVPGNALGPK